MTTPYTVEAFGGLSLGVDALEVGPTQATNLLNVELDAIGRIRTRPGTVKANTSTPSSTSYLALAAFSDGTTTVTPRLLAVTRDSSQDLVTHVLRTDGTLSDPVGSALADSGNWDVGSIVPLGTDVIPYVFITRWEATTGHTLVYLNATTALSYARSTIATKPWLVAAWQFNFRLVLAGFSAAADGPGGVNGSTSTVWFSEPGDPLTFGANNYVKLNPGDGEVITALADFNDQIYVFKQRSIYVFYGTSVDADGQPIFNFRRITLTDPVIPRNGTYRPAAVGSPEGVYFSARGGIYLTAGDAPVCVSDAVRPIFQPDDTGLIPANMVSTDSQPALSYVDRRLYVRYSTSDGEMMLVYDSRIQQWTIFSIPSQTGKTMAAFPANSAGNTAQYTIAGADIWALSRAATDDRGTPITWSYTSGKYALSDPSRVAITLESSVVGCGTVSLRNTTDVYGADGAATSMTLGVSPATAEGWHQVDNEGTSFQHTLSGTGPAQVNRLAHHIQFVKPDGIR